MSISSIRKRFTRQKFQNFLDNQPSRKRAGYPAHAQHCPLAAYLNKGLPDNTTVSITHLNWFYYLSGNPSVKKNMPKWASNFAMKVDAHQFDRTYLTYGHCARILRDL